MLLDEIMKVPEHPDIKEMVLKFETKSLRDTRGKEACLHFNLPFDARYFEQCWPQRSVYFRGRQLAPSALENSRRICS